MTMLVFDGAHFWADGKSTFRNKELDDMNRGNYQKLVILDAPMKAGTNTFLTAVASTGDSKDGTAVINEVNRAAKNGETLHHVRSRLHDMLQDKMDCWVVGVGYRIKSNGEKEAMPFTVFNGTHWLGSRFQFSGNGTKKLGYCMAGDTTQLPMHYEVDWIKSAGDIMTLGTIINDRGVGGQLSRYNPVTGKLDHPKPYNEVRQRSLYKKWEQYKLKGIHALLEQTKATLDKRFLKVEEK